MSNDDGRTWTSPRVINDSPLDDRDVGIVSLGGRKLALAWFTTDNRGAPPTAYQQQLDAWDAARWQEGLASMTDEGAARYVGSWVRISGDSGITWNEPVRVSVSAPHGPIRLASGILLYFGKQLASKENDWTISVGGIGAIGSVDDGNTWEPLGSVPLADDEDFECFHEPHSVELPGGRIVGLIRNDPNHHDYRNRQPGQTDFEMYQTVSDDGGKTWSAAEPLGFHGSPPHLLLHSIGALACVYGYREKPYGERVMISRDRAESWEYDYVLRDDGPHPDLGYPSSVELGDGSILTVYYQRGRRPPRTSAVSCGPAGCCRLDTNLTSSRLIDNAGNHPNCAKNVGGARVATDKTASPNSMEIAHEAYRAVGW